MKHTILFLILPIMILTQLRGQVVSRSIGVVLTNEPNRLDYHLDFDLDGMTDFTIQYRNNYGAGGAQTYTAHMGSYVDNEVVNPAYLDVTVFNNGDQIGPGATGWYNPNGDFDPSGFFSYPRLAYRFASGGPPNPPITGNFRDLSNKFIGVRFFDNGNTHYGYIEVSCIVTPMSSSFIEIHTIGYNTVPDQPILAGEQACTMQTFYVDTDGDGFGDPLTSVDSCDQPSGYVIDATDCDDRNSAVNPAAIEICNNIDDNCDGQINEGISQTWFFDGDNDGFGIPMIAIDTCIQLPGYADNDLDCDDNNPLIHPNAAEICNNLDDDCDGQIDNGITIPLWFLDGDGDGYGTPLIFILGCVQPQSFVLNDLDCDDNNPLIHPNATEVCNNLDDNCDGLIDNGIVIPLWFFDGDRDGYGTPLTFILACTQPVDFVMNNLDCDDNDPLINPVATEICNNLDDNCDGQIDEGVQLVTYYLDLDTDGFGDAANIVDSCSQPLGYADVAGDCNDNNPLINPGTTEVCNNLDDNCDGIIDESTLSADLHSMNPTASGLLNGSAWIVASGGVLPYSYEWNTGLMDSLINNLDTGYYSVTVTDAVECHSIHDVQLTTSGCPVLVPVTTTRDAQCNGACNGIVLFDTILNATYPLTYDWSFGTTSLPYDSTLCMGSYFVTITDASNCQAIERIDIGEPDLLEIQLALDSSVIVSGGTTPYRDTTFEAHGNVLIASVIDTHGCLAADSLILSSTLIQRIHERITVAPNPTAHELNINYPESPDISEIIYLFDGYKKIVEISERPEYINVSSYPTGMYYLLYFSDKDNYHIPIIVIK